jgi:hypothetical protein
LEEILPRNTLKLYTGEVCWEWLFSWLIHRLKEGEKEREKNVAGDEG